MTPEISETLPPQSEAQSLVQAVRRVAVNLGWLLSSQAVTRLIGFAFGTFLARYFGPHDYGEYVFVLAYVTYFGFLADGGLGRFLIREIARDGANLDRYLGGVVGLRLVLSAFAYLLLVVIAALSHTPGAANGSIAVAGLTLFSGAFSGAVGSIFDARQEMHITAAFQVIATAGNAIFILFALGLGFGLRGAFVAFALANLPPLTYLLLMLGRRDCRLRVAVTPQLWRHALGQSLPYAVLGVIGLIFFRIDSLMLTWIKSPQETGVYAASYRLIEALAVLPGVAVSAAFPLLARLHVESRATLRHAYFGALAILGVGALPVALATWIFAPLIIHLLYGGGAYAASVDLLRILSLALLIIFVDTANTMLLYSGDDLRTVLLLSLVTTGANVGMNLVLIPRYGYTGAAWSTVLSELLSLAIFTPTVLRYLYQ